MAVALEALGARGSYASRNPLAVRDVAGRHVADLSLVPVPYVARTMSALHRAEPLDRSARTEALHAAADLFEHGTIDGLDLEVYLHLVSEVSGLGISTGREAAQKIVAYCHDAAEHADFARPAAAMSSWSDPAIHRGGAMWVRRRSVFAVLTAGNHPGTHVSWIQALAVGYRVAIRPSRKEPFTPHRLVSALRLGGFPDDVVALLPCDYDGADEMVRSADLAMVYGGDDVMHKYSGSRTVMPQGPGRSKVLVTAGSDWEASAALVADSITHGGGTGCTNATGVLVDGDVSAFAEAVAAHLRVIPSLAPTDPSAVLPVQPLAAALDWRARLVPIVGDASAVLGLDGMVDDLGDGSAVMRPIVHVVSGPSAPQLRAELPFPAAWIAPWNPAAGMAPLADTLVLTVTGGSEELLDRLIDEPGIRNVYAGAIPTYWTAPGVPHDGFLADFLMEPKGVRA
ncbi:MAG TPA: aldehyde dehydrogenase family protein [Pseudolysinimonas sp.]|jgi:acyl-CoA reductase-like NAD-dependent aldehyde dehydrogenase